jgi:membrane-associated phospholipid phosphatase
MMANVAGQEENVPYRKQYSGGIHAVLRFTPILYPIIATSVAFALASRQAFELLGAYLVGFVVVSLLVKIIKKIAKQERPPHKLLSPTGEKTEDSEQCSHIFKFAMGEGSERQMVKKEKGHGMPSGHAALSAYTLVFMVLVVVHINPADLGDLRSWRTRSYLLGAMLVAFLCLGTMVHRIVLICHTPAQVLVGSLVGVLVAFAFYYLVKFMQKNNVLAKWLGDI